MGSPACIALVGSVASVIEGASMDRWLARLSAHERARALAFRYESDRQSYVAAHWIVRLGASLLTGQPADEFVLTQRCDDCGGPHGRPRIEECPALFVTLSRTRTGVAAAASLTPVGIDLEVCGGVTFDDLRSSTAYSQAERARLERLPRAAADSLALQWWTRKECLIKLGRLSLDAMGCFDTTEHWPADLTIAESCHRASHSVGCVAIAGLTSVDGLQWHFID